MARRRFTAEFKTRLVLEVLREEKPLGEVAAENEISPNQLRNWKREFLANATRVFSESKYEKELRAKEKAMDEERNELMAKVVNSQSRLTGSKKICRSAWTQLGGSVWFQETVNCRLADKVNC